MTARKQVILETAVRLLAEHGPDGFTIDDVLVESGASASSLYHHFGNREGLVAAAERHRYATSWDDRDRRQVETGLEATTNEELLEFIAAELRRIATDPERPLIRQARVQAVAKSFDSPEVAASRARVQDAVIEAITSVFSRAKERGIVPPDLDPRAYAAWYFGMALGRVFTEDGTLDAESWLAVAIPAALAPLRMAPR